MDLKVVVIGCNNTSVPMETVLSDIPHDHTIPAKRPLARSLRELAKNRLQKIDNEKSIASYQRLYFVVTDANVCKILEDKGSKLLNTLAGKGEIDFLGEFDYETCIEAEEYFVENRKQNACLELNSVLEQIQDKVSQLDEAIKQDMQRNNTISDSATVGKNKLGAPKTIEIQETITDLCSDINWYQYSSDKYIKDGITTKILDSGKVDAIYWK